MDQRDLTLHGFILKRHASPAAVASLIGLPEEAVASEIQALAASGRATAAQGGYSVAPLARVALEARYGLHFGDLRENESFAAACERFEIINKTLKQIITDWQMMEVRGERAPNDHSDAAYDARIIDRLGRLHEQAGPVLRALALPLPRLAIYARKLTDALERAEDGEIDWVSDIRRESYHTVWFELHEDLLRIMNRKRDD